MKDDSSSSLVGVISSISEIDAVFACGWNLRPLFR
jgi:hypothetical protein